MIYFITGNQNKFKEVSEILDFEVKQLDIDLVEIQELDAKKVIEHKLFEAVKVKGDNECFLVEDTSLYIDALGGMPGPLIKWFLKSMSLGKIARIGSGKACAITYIGFYEKGKIRYFKGEVRGKIVNPIGDNGFGWDKIFMPDGYDKTFAQMSDDEKNKVSMRRLALEEMNKEWRR